LGVRQFVGKLRELRRYVGGGEVQIRVVSAEFVQVCGGRLGEYSERIIEVAEIRAGLRCPLVDVVKVGHSLSYFGFEEPKIIGKIIPKIISGLIKRRYGVFEITTAIPMR